MFIQILLLLIYIFSRLISLSLWNSRQALKVNELEKQLQFAEATIHLKDEISPLNETFQKIEKLKTSLISLKLFMASKGYM